MLDAQTAFANLATSKKRKDDRVAAREIEEGRALQDVKVGRSRRRPNSDIQRPNRGIRFAVDSPLEGEGFEPSVPRPR